MSVSGAFMASTYRNDDSDGTSSNGCAIARFNIDHPAVEIHTMAEPARLLDTTLSRWVPSLSDPTSR